MGGIIEEFIVAAETRSSSVQMRISPNGDPRVVSSHEHVLVGSTGHAYLGCRFPADEQYRERLLDDAAQIGEVLSRCGILGRADSRCFDCRTHQQTPGRLNRRY